MSTNPAGGSAEGTHAVPDSQTPEARHVGIVNPDVWLTRAEVLAVGIESSVESAVEQESDDASGGATASTRWRTGTREGLGGKRQEA